MRLAPSRCMRFTVIATILLVTSVASADEAKEQATKRTPTDFNDYLFPKTGRVSATVATGAPFAAIGELSVGVANRFAVGAMVGAGPFAGGIVMGIRPRVDVVHVGPMRLVLA